MLLWRNAWDQPTENFGPAPEKACAADFVNLYNMEKTLFAKDIADIPYSGAAALEKRLRAIREYTDLAEEGRQRRLTESQYLYLEKLLEDNVARSKELRERYGGVD